VRVLVTGGLGVNGAVLIRTLLEMGHEPICADRSGDLSLLTGVTGDFPVHDLDVLDLQPLAQLMEVERVRAEVADVPISLGPGWDYLGLGSTYALMDISRAREQLGYEPVYGLSEGLRDYAASIAAAGKVG
jgi:nucleoside-diphosphate-sugar epimerase